MTPRAHDTTHVVKVVCHMCDHHGYQRVKLGEEVAHECYNLGMGGPTVTMTICAWEYEDDSERYSQRGCYPATRPPGYDCDCTEEALVPGCQTHLAQHPCPDCKGHTFQHEEGCINS